MSLKYQFKTIAWKNGQGETTELAISPGGTLTDF
jgi:environmental stress-induced protein Ves